MEEGWGDSWCSLPSLIPSEGVTRLGLTKFEAKIGQGNEPSIRMFRKLHFEQVRLVLVRG